MPQPNALCGHRCLMQWFRLRLVMMACIVVLSWSLFGHVLSLPRLGLLSDGRLYVGLLARTARNASSARLVMTVLLVFRFVVAHILAVGLVIDIVIIGSVVRAVR